jgi:hypothetical protein
MFCRAKRLAPGFMMLCCRQASARDAGAGIGQTPGDPQDVLRIFGKLSRDMATDAVATGGEHGDSEPLGAGEIGGS